jgi:flagellar protein FliT
MRIGDVMNSLELISIYESVAVITDQMLNAARSGDWDRLVELEASCTMQVQSIKENEEPVVLPETDREKKIQAIKKILKDDREIRNLTEPWMAKLSLMMQHSATQRKLDAIYKGGY